MTISGVELQTSSSMLLGIYDCGAASQDSLLGEPAVSTAPNATQAVYVFATPTPAVVGSGYFLCWHATDAAAASEYVMEVSPETQR